MAFPYPSELLFADDFLYANGTLSTHVPQVGPAWGIPQQGVTLYDDITVTSHRATAPTGGSPAGYLPNVMTIQRLPGDWFLSARILLLAAANERDIYLNWYSNINDMQWGFQLTYSTGSFVMNCGIGGSVLTPNQPLVVTNNALDMTLDHTFSLIHHSGVNTIEAFIDGVSKGSAAAPPFSGVSSINGQTITDFTGAELFIDLENDVSSPPVPQVLWVQGGVGSYPVLSTVAKQYLQCMGKAAFA